MKLKIKQCMFVIFFPYFDINSSTIIFDIRWALGNIAGDCREFKEFLINEGILQNLLLICQSKYDEKFNTNFMYDTDNEQCNDHNKKFLGLV